ncbi:MAG: hypothetical protein RIQ38_2583 [Pseudomonadota bacterium]|jgi:CubicO group peptidase (beta-lactamase class C family)
MKALKRIVLTLLVLGLLGAAWLQLAGHGYIWRALQLTYLQGHRTAHIDDAPDFAQAKVANGAVQPWAVSKQPAELPPETRHYLQKHGSAAFVVVHRGEIVHESYFAPYGPTSATNSFSMAKSIVTMLAGAAEQDGLIESFDAPIGRYLPEYAKHPLGQRATLAQLSAMTSGHEWDENYYLPLNKTTELYFGRDAQATVLGQGFEGPPGERWEYSSASTQVLAIALQRALAAKSPGLTLSEYLSRRFWQPLGMSQPASWSLDRPREQGGMELAYCCLHINARDMARIGQLLLQNGQWQGKPLLPAAFVERMRTPLPQARFYGHSLWMDPDHSAPFYFLQGHQGQYVIVVPSEQLVVVRLGQFREQVRWRHPKNIEEIYLFADVGRRMVAGR